MNIVKKAPLLLICSLSAAWRLSGMFVVLPGKVVSVGQTISKIPPEQLMSTPTVADLLQSRKRTLKRAFRTLYHGMRLSFL